MSKPKQHITLQEAESVSKTLRKLSETQPPENQQTKGAIIANNRELIEKALKLGWTQKQIVDLIYQETGVSITTETLRAHAGKVRSGKRPKRVSEKDGLQKKAKRDKPSRRRRTTRPEKVQPGERPEEQPPAQSGPSEQSETDAAGSEDRAGRPHAGTVEEDY